MIFELGQRVLVQVRLSKLSEPYWWHHDEKDRHVMTLFGLQRRTTSDGIAIWSLFVGPVLVNFGVT